MNYFAVLFSLEVKSRLRSYTFLASVVFFLFLSLVMAAALPQDGKNSLQVGLCISGEKQIGKTLEVLLLENEGYEFRRYDEQEQDKMEQDVLNGTLHCAYLFEEDQVPPFTVLETDASFMRPLADEIVISAYFEAAAPEWSAGFLESAGYPAEGIPEAFERLSSSEAPMLIELREVGTAGMLEQKGSFQPLLYAVLVSVFLFGSILEAAAAGKQKPRIHRRLAIASRKRLATVAAPVCAGILLNMVLLACADLVISFSAGQSIYSLSAKITALFTLAAVSAILSIIVTPLKKGAAIIVFLVPLLAAASIFFSGAIIDPSMLPGGLGVLRFLSPAWYLLRLMGG